MKGRATPSTRDDNELTEALRSRMDKLRLFLNGDIRADGIQHYCTGCCAHTAEMVANIAAAIDDGIFSLLGGDLPLKKRRGSCAKHLGIQAAGHTLHSILNGVLLASFPKWDTVDAATDAVTADDRGKFRAVGQQSMASVP